MKTKRDISICVLIIVLGLAMLLPLMLFDSFSQNIVGRIWMGFAFLVIFLGLLKIEQIEIEENKLTKANFIFKRTIDLKKIKKYKVKANNLNTHPGYNIVSIMKIFKNVERYSNFRFLTIYTEGKRRLKIDERTMPISDFKKVLNEIKRRR